MNDSEFNAQIKPFFWSEYEGSYSACFEVDMFQYQVWQQSDKGFEGGGYDWENVARAFLQEQHPEWQAIIKFDPESSMFCAYSESKDVLQQFVLAFRQYFSDEKNLLTVLETIEPD